MTAAPGTRDAHDHLPARFRRKVEFGASGNPMASRGLLGERGATAMPGFALLRVA